MGVRIDEVDETSQAAPHAVVPSQQITGRPVAELGSPIQPVMALSELSLGDKQTQAGHCLETVKQNLYSFP